MKFLSILLFIGIGTAQQPTSHIIAGPSLPARCSYLSGDIYFLSSGNTGLYLCGAGGTFSVGPLITSTGSSLPSGAAGGVLAGTYPNPTLANLSQKILFTPDAIYDIGASAANRPHNMYLSNNLFAGIIETTFGDVIIQASGITLGVTRTITGLLSIAPIKYLTATNCTNAASPAVCAAAAAGNVALAAGATTLQVNTTAVTVNSAISVTRNDSLGTVLTVTCDTQSSLVLGAPRVTAISAGTSFTISIDVGPTTNPLCLTYSIVN